MHLIWFSLVVPLMGFSVWAFPRLRRSDIWTYCFTIALAAVAVWTGVRWFQLGFAKNGLSLQTVFATLISEVDTPGIAFVLGSFLNLMVVRFILRQFKPQAEPTVMKTGAPISESQPAVAISQSLDDDNLNQSPAETPVTI